MANENIFSRKIFLRRSNNVFPNFVLLTSPENRIGSAARAWMRMRQPLRCQQTLYAVQCTQSHSLQMWLWVQYIQSHTFYTESHKYIKLHIFKVPENINTKIKPSIRSNKPPWPGINMPVSLTLFFLLK